MKTLALTLALGLAATASAGVPDSVFVRPHSNGDGLQLSWSSNQQLWEPVVSHQILSSDFGTWGAQKKMYNPQLLQGYDGLYVLIFQPVRDGNANQFAVATTRDFVHWRPQDFPYMKGVKQCLNPTIACTGGGKYEVTFTSEGKHYSTTSTDLVHFSNPVQVDAAKPQAPLRMAYSTLEAIKANDTYTRQLDALHAERSHDDPQRFAGVGTVEADVVVSGADSKAISDKLIGIFFEDINYSADGGLYAELVQNRDFEYCDADHRGWNSMTAWTCVGEGASVSISTDDPIHPNNSHYAVLSVTDASKASLRNSGFDGIVIRKGEYYDVSAFLRQQSGKSQKLKVVLRDEKNGSIIGQTVLTASAGSWKQQKSVIKANADADNAILSLEPTAAGTLAIDFVSLFPQETFHGRKNGLRKDLCETLEALHPQFMRFPGGCVAHGNGVDNIYNWKETLGPLWERKAQPNLWGYHQSKGLGYYEYFLFCEDLAMEPLPVLAAAVPCQNSSWGGHGQQGGVPMEKMDAYIQDVLDLIEWANGDAKTTEWGRKRAELGHPKPFNLKYIGIGNEDLISPTFEERYLMIIKAVKEKYPDIIVCGTVGPFWKGADYERGWQIAADHNIDMVDEHYYNTPAWYIYNHTFYDQYDRSQSKVYLGEYAAHVSGRKSTVETALACALHICALERNGDVVELSSYAPLLAKNGHTQWNPNMIYFDNTKVYPTVDYYTQMMSGQHAGDTYCHSTIALSEASSKTIAQKHHEALNARLAVSTVKNSKTGKTYLKLVSMLPMSVKTHLSLSDLDITAAKDCKAVVLSGPCDSTDSEPVETNITVSSDCTIELAPYSFTIIEL